MQISLPALIVLVVILIPNLLFIFFPPRSIPDQLKGGGVLLNIFEHGGRIIFFVLFLFCSNTNVPTEPNPLLFLAILFTVLYELLWLRYFINQRAFHYLYKSVAGIPVPMALFPISAFLFAAIGLGAFWALIPLLAFAAGHIINTWITAKQLAS